MSKRTIDDDAAIGLFDTLPINVVAQFLIDTEMLRINALMINASTRARIAAAMALPAFYQSLTLACFPGLTRLPFDAQHMVNRGFVSTSRAWALHLARLIHLLRRVTLSMVISPSGALHSEKVVQHVSEPSTCRELTQESRLHFSLRGITEVLFATFGVEERVIEHRMLKADSWFAINERHDDDIGRTRYITVDFRPRRMTDRDVERLIVRAVVHLKPSRIYRARAHDHIKVTRLEYSPNTSRITGPPTSTTRMTVARSTTISEVVPDTHAGALYSRYGDRTIVTQFYSVLHQIMPDLTHTTFDHIMSIDETDITIKMYRII